jgi:hypothetical protein
MNRKPKIQATSIAVMNWSAPLLALPLVIAMSFCNSAQRPASYFKASDLTMTSQQCAGSQDPWRAARLDPWRSKRCAQIDAAE